MNPTEFAKERDLVTNASSRTQGGTVLGAARAEIDKDMLEKAFLETAEYTVLTQGTHHNFVVGRRGAGKSALFRRIGEHFHRDKRAILIGARPLAEEDVAALRSQLRRATQGVMDPGEQYRLSRYICRAAWKANLLATALEQLRGHHKIINSRLDDALTDYSQHHRDLVCDGKVMSCDKIVANVLRDLADVDPEGIPQVIVTRYQINDLQSLVSEAIRTVKRRVVVLYDGLDEGWQPSAYSTAILGGLAHTAANLADNDSGIHIILFIRDNMFRALAQLDGDFSRHIEGNTLRLHWDENTLLGLVAKRVRVALDVSVESDIKIWNRFARGEMQNRDGFRRCLQNTLYRPRDVLVLLNATYGNAIRNGRDAIIAEDLDAAATQISRDRLEDLLKEYEGVLPGLRHFVQCFRSKGADLNLGTVLGLLDHAVQNNEILERSAADFAILGSGREIASALFSVGFLGVHNTSLGKYRFSHDGTTSEVDFRDENVRTLVHPCYWRALDLESPHPSENVVVEIHDEYDEKETERDEDDVSNLRFRRLGQILGELPQIPFGADGVDAFATWVRNTLRILFQGRVGPGSALPEFDNPGLRGMGAVNHGTNGFWARVKSDYEAQFIRIVVANHDELKADDFAAVAYQPKQPKFGRFTLVVNRSAVEGLGTWERERVRMIWNQNNNLLFVLPVQILLRCVGKLRAPKLKMRFEYADEQFIKRLDTFEKTYLKGTLRL